MAERKLPETAQAADFVRNRPCELAHGQTITHMCTYVRCTSLSFNFCIRSMSLVAGVYDDSTRRCSNKKFAESMLGAC